MLESELRIAFANFGLDYDSQTSAQRKAVIERVEECGSCACTFYTGHTVYEHTCWKGKGASRASVFSK